MCVLLLSVVHAIVIVQSQMSEKRVENQRDVDRSPPFLFTPILTPIRAHMFWVANVIETLILLFGLSLTAFIGR